mmetsp:Transcript_112552/g.299031  ORF Transcript_112552/g.299031 Transcript_112552/m.299031 type:complete len:129 (+) Transcript_112552:122-508(+)
MRVAPVARRPSATSAMRSTKQSAKRKTRNLLLSVGDLPSVAGPPRLPRLGKQQSLRCRVDTFGSSSGSTAAAKVDERCQEATGGASTSRSVRLTGTTCGLPRARCAEEGDFLRLRQQNKGEDGSRSLR